MEIQREPCSLSLLYLVDVFTRLIGIAESGIEASANEKYEEIITRDRKTNMTVLTSECMSRKPY